MRDIPDAIFHIGFVQGRLSKILEKNDFHGELKDDFDKCIEHLKNAASCLIEPETDQDIIKYIEEKGLKALRKKEKNV